MTRRWKCKTNSSHILLVLITLILVKAEWVGARSPEEDNTIDDSSQQTQVYVGNDEIADYYFGSSAGNESSVLEGIGKCLESFQLITCVKMLLLRRINEVGSLMEESADVQKDLHILNGMLTLKAKNATTNPGLSETENELSLDEEIAAKVRKMFRKRSLLVNLLPKTRIEIEPSPESSKDGFICFRFAIHQDSTSGDEVEGRKRKSSGMPMMMMVPQLIMLGLMPFTLASLKAMVMNAVMINMMALNGAIFMTIRNLVFGPRKGDNVKYVNYGYSKDRQTQSRRPVLIIHSPAAFVKQPPVHRYRRPPAFHAAHSYFPDNHLSSEGSSFSHQHHSNAVHDYEDQYYTIQENGNFHLKNEHQHSRSGAPIEQKSEPKLTAGISTATSQTSNQRYSALKPELRRDHLDQKHAFPSTRPHASYQSQNKNFYSKTKLQSTGI